MDGMNIYYNYTVEVNNTEHMATLKEGDIHLYIGDKNIDYYFKVEKAQFTFRGTSETESLIESTMPSKAAVSVLKPNGDIVIGSEAEVVGSRIKWTVTPDLIDEDVEVGDFTLAISLIESSTDSMATLPPITNQVHIHERVTPTPGSSLNAVVNEAVVGLAQVQSDDTALDVFDSEGNYIKTVWKSGDKITQTKLNKIEDGLSGLSTQFKDIANELGDETLQTNAQDLKGAINEVFQNASNGKTLIAQAITGKGINATSNDTWQELATKISQILGSSVKINSLNKLSDCKFKLISSTSNTSYNSTTETTKNYNDSAWDDVTIPHDWSIYNSFNSNSPSGYEGGYLDGGEAGYRWK